MNDSSFRRSIAAPAHHLALLLVCLLAAGAAEGQAWRGANSLHGSVLDAEGAPVAEIEIRLTWVDGQESAAPVTTDDQGRFVAAGLAAGTWTIELTVPGHYPAKGRAVLTDGRLAEPLDFRLRSLDEELPAATEGYASTIEAWIEKGDQLARDERWSDARKEYLRAVGALPTGEHPPLLEVIARTRFMEGDVDGAVEDLERALQIGPNAARTRQIYLTLMENLDRTAEAEAYLADLPEPPPETAPGAPAFQVPPEVKRWMEAEALSPVAGATGDMKLRFEDRSPLTTLAEYTDRGGYDEASILATDPAALSYSLGDESFLAFVPEVAPDGGYGLLVWVAPTPFGGVRSEELKAELSKRGVIWVGANDAGNPRMRWDRSGLAVDAVAAMSEAFPIDPERVWVAGYSGGGRVASHTVMFYPEVFRGAFFLHGIDYFRPVPVPDRPGHSWPAAFGKPSRARYKLLRSDRRFAIITGERDFNRQQGHEVRRMMEVDGFDHVTLVEMPGADHYAGLPREVLAEVLDFLDR